MTAHIYQSLNSSAHWAQLFSAQRLGSHKKLQRKTARAHPFIKIMTDWCFRTLFGSSIKKPKSIH